MYVLDENGNVIYVDEDGSVLDDGIYDSEYELSAPIAIDESGDVLDGGLDSELGDDPVVVYSMPAEMYDGLIDALASVSTPSIYPSTAAVTVFQYALQSYENYRYYAIIPGTSTSDVYLYTADDFSVSGSTVTLTGDVKVHRYYTYRPGSSSSTQYLYQVSSSGDVSFSLGSTLIYTNTMEGYPDIYPESEFKQPVYSRWLLIAVFVILVLVLFRRWKHD